MQGRRGFPSGSRGDPQAGSEGCRSGAQLGSKRGHLYIVLGRLEAESSYVVIIGTI